MNSEIECVQPSGTTCIQGNLTKKNKKQRCMERTL